VILRTQSESFGLCVAGSSPLANPEKEGGIEMKLWIALGLVLLLATSVFGLEKKAYQMREDFGTEPLGDFPCQYYYYIPCPTYSWFWAFTGWEPCDWIGVCFECWEENTGCYDPNDPWMDHTVQMIRILDFAGYGTIYPGQFDVEFFIFCQDPVTKNPVEDPDNPGYYKALWRSGCMPTHFGWNYIMVDPPVCVTECCLDPGPPPAYPAVLVMAHHNGTTGIYPAWGLDNISTAIEQGCILHDYCCLPAHYPRPYVCYWDQIHSGYYGNWFNPPYPELLIPAPFPYCPPLNFCDGRDTTCVGSLCYPDGINGWQFGFIELAWRLYFDRSGPTATEGTTWGNIKSMYR
jgi:hypothetical protein